MATWKQPQRRLDRISAMVEKMQSWVDQAEESAGVNGNTTAAHLLAAMRQATELHKHLLTMNEDLIELAVQHTNLTQRQMEEALGVPKGTLRGLRRGARV